MTVIYLLEDGKILLGKKRKKEGGKNIGVGLWNGPGGLVEGYETIEENARREVLEETGLMIFQLKKVGIILARYTELDFEIELHYFLAEAPSQELKPSSEFEKMCWFNFGKNFENIPFSKMWPSDKILFPIFFYQRQYAVGEIVMNNQEERRISWHNIRAVDVLPETTKFLLE